MSNLPVISGEECLKLLMKIGYRFLRQKGSHVVVRKDEPFSQIVIPNHKVLDRGTLRGIIKQTGLSVEEFNKIIKPNSFIKYLMGARVYDPQIGRFLSVDPLLNVFPSHSPYSYSFNNPISYSDPTGLAPEKEKGGGNKIQHMNWFELLKESWQQYNVEYQNSWMIEKILEKLNRDMFWNDQLNSLLAMANNADIGVDESAEMARKARQGRLGNGEIKIDGNKGTTKYSIGGYSMTVSWTVEKVESEEELNNSVREAGRKVIESLDRIADAGEYGFSIMKDFVREMYKTKQTLHFDLTFSGYDLANLWNKSCGTNYEFILGVSSNSWLFYDVRNETCNVQGINKGSIYIAKEFLSDLSEIKKYSIYEYNTSFRYTFSMVFYHEFKHKYDSMFEFIPFDKEVSARRFVNYIFDFYIMRYRIIRF